MHTRRDLLARGAFVASVIVITIGGWMAGRLFEPEFDWRYRVVSALASHKHNPAGAIWFSSALAIALLLLWPVTSRLGAGDTNQARGARFFVGALRVGLLGGVLVGLERALFFHLSDVVRKGHELIALVTFLSLYIGVLGCYCRHLDWRRGGFWPVVAVLVPLVGAGCSELLLYLGQRGVGWVDQDWREIDRPVWLSFAFWQWLAVVMLWVGFGGLAFLPLRHRERSARNGPRGAA